MSIAETAASQTSPTPLADHLPKASERIAAEATGDPQPEGTPELIPAHRLRIRQRSAFLLLATKGQAIFGTSDLDEVDSEAFKAPVNEATESEHIGTPITPELLDYISEIDEALEAVAVDADTYSQWATGAEAEQHVTSLFEWYVSRLGESQDSAS